jgi:predicted dehydrogenase
VEDTVHALARHGRVMGCYSLNQHQAANESTISVVCSRGIVRFEYHKHRWRWAAEPGAEWHDESFDALERDSLFVHQAQAFLDLLDAEARPLCSLQEAVQTLRVNLAILASAEKRTWQKVFREAPDDV